jgi:hypothetical protein
MRYRIITIGKPCLRGVEKESTREEILENFLTI